MKYAQANATIVWILLILFLVVGALFINRASADVRGTDVEMAKCVSDMKTSSLISKFSKGKVDSDFKCPTKSIVVPQDASDDETKKILAQSLVACSDLWDRGEKLMFAKDAVYCHVCNDITFENKEPLTGSMWTYLANNPTEGSTYLAQLTGVHDAPTVEQVLFASSQIKSTIDRTKKHAIIFVYARNETLLSPLFGKLEKDDAVQGGIVVGAAVIGGAACYLSIGCGIVVTLAAGTAVISSYIFDNPPEFGGATFLTEYDAESIAQLGCEIVPTG